MDNSTKTILMAAGSFILGAGLSGCATYIVASRYFKKKCDDEIQAQTEYYMRKYDPKLKEDISDDSSNKEESNEEEQAGVQSKKEDISNLYRSSAPEEMDKTAYGSYFSGDSSNTSNDISDKKSTKKKVNRKGSLKMVTSEEWNANPNNYEKKFLVYYDADEVMIDEESEQAIDHGEELVGKDNLDQADQFDDVIFVSNSKTKTIYQVTVEQAAFSEVGYND